MLVVPPLVTAPVEGAFMRAKYFYCCRMVGCDCNCCWEEEPVKLCAELEFEWTEGEGSFLRVTIWGAACLLM